MKRIIISFIIAICCFCLYNNHVNHVNAAKPVKLNRSEVTLKKGKSLKLTLKNAKKKKVKWTTKNKKIVFVNNLGKIKALRTGKTKIYAKYKSKKYVCHVNVVSNKKAKTTVASSPAPAANPTQMPDTTKRPDDSIVSVLKDVYISDVIANSYDWFIMIDYIDESNNQKFSNSYQSLQNAEITLNGNRVAVSELKKGDILEIGYVGNISEDLFATIPNVKYIKATR